MSFAKYLQNYPYNVHISYLSYRKDGLETDFVIIEETPKPLEEERYLRLEVRSFGFHFVSEKRDYEIELEARTEQWGEFIKAYQEMVNKLEDKFIKARFEKVAVSLNNWLAAQYEQKINPQSYPDYGDEIDALPIWTTVDAYPPNVENDWNEL